MKIAYTNFKQFNHYKMSKAKNNKVYVDVHLEEDLDQDLHLLNEPLAEPLIKQLNKANNAYE